MFHSRCKNRRINHLHERGLRWIYDDYELTFEELLEKNGSFAIHHYNVQTLFIELYEVYGSNSIMYHGPIVWSLVPEEIRYTGSPPKN